ncbi:MAG: hypothetical protein HDR52_05430 [Treponema sp.]|nr:hypothetical protein [Treponema sp.]
MKSVVFKWTVLCAVIFGLCCIGCTNDPDSDKNSGDQQGAVTVPGENPNDQPKTVTLQERLASAKNGEVIDITAEGLISTENVSLVVEKAVTIKNGSAKDSVFEIKVSGVTFDGVSGVKEFTIAKAVGDGGFTVKNGDELKYLVIDGGETESSSSIRIVSTTVESAVVGKKGVHIVLGENGSSPVSSIISRAAQSRAASRASIKKLTVNESCILESLERPSDGECGFSRVSVANGVESLTLRGSAAIEQLVVTSSESKIFIGSTDVKIENGGAVDGEKLSVQLEEGVEGVEIPKIKALNINPAWKIWMDEAYENDGGKAVINDFGEDSITVTANKTPSRYPWDANLNFWYTLEEEAQYLVEFEAKFTGAPKETSFNIYDGTKKSNICVAPFAPTTEWKKYSFMASINSGDAKKYEGDEIEFSFRLTEGTLEVKNFKIYNCWTEGLHDGLEKWDTWFDMTCGVSIMMYDVSKDSAKAFRVLDNHDAVIDRWMVNVGYKLENLEAGTYEFSFHSETKNLNKLNVHIGGEHNGDLGQASGFKGPGDYYVRFEVPKEKSDGWFVMQFLLDVPVKDEMEERFFVLADTLDVSKVKFGVAGSVNIPSDSTELVYSTEIVYD